MAFQDESSKLFVGRLLKAGEIGDWLAAQQAGAKPATRVFTHHTWRPNQHRPFSRSSLDGVFAYYRKDLGWPEGVGPHFFVCADGAWAATHFRHDGIHVKGQNSRSVGVEVVWDGDEAAFAGPTLDNLVVLMRALANRLQISMDESHFRLHNEYSAKSCPGSKNPKNWLLEQYRSRAVGAVPDKPPPPPDDWTPEAKRLKELGVVTGYGDGSFGADLPATRGDMAVFLARFADWLERNFERRGA
jgi:hypothetical protein